MKSPEQVKLEFTQEWVRKAESDFETARHLLEGGKSFVYGTAFHSQQAAEKYIKAFLVWHQIEFPKTHDIKDLLKLCSQVDPVTTVTLTDANALTPYGVDYRYPGDYPDITLQEAEEAVRLAECVRLRIRTQLPGNVVG